MYSVRGAGRGDPLDQMSMDEGSQTGTRPKRNDSGSGNNTSGQNQIIGKLSRLHVWIKTVFRIRIGLFFLSPDRPKNPHPDPDPKKKVQSTKICIPVPYLALHTVYTTCPFWSGSSKT